MFNVELYISGTRVDMFKDENIEITDTIQNARDISKVFTTFSQSFTLPASPTNNKLFRHYYDSKVTQPLDTGIDARFKFDAEIRLDGFTFRRGKIKLNETKLRDNKPYSYSVNFTGELAELNTTFKDGSLDTLDLDDYDHDYDLSTVIDGVELGLAGSPMARSATADVFYPLITHTKVYEIDTSLTGVEMYDTVDGNGLEFDQLKPAIKASIIIDAIESKYGVTFSTDFFGSSRFSALYMWLCRNAGPIVSSSKSIGVADGPDIATGWDTLGDDVISNSGYGTSLILVNKFTDGFETQMDWSIEVSSFTGTGNFTLYFEDIYSTKTRLFQVYDNETGGGPYTTYTFSSDVPVNEKLYQPRIKIIADSTLTSVDLTVVATRRLYDQSGVYDTDTGTYVYTLPLVAGFIKIEEQIPQMKVLDFINGLFRMYNLTAYIKDDGEIYVDTLDNFYALGTDIDITEYIDISESEVAPPMPFDEIEFKHSKTSLISGNEFYEITNEEWGSESYKLEWDLGTGKYIVDTGFEHIMFDRRNDLNSGDPANVLMGFCIDKDLNPVATNGPLMFYKDGTQTIPGGNNLIWSDGTDSTFYQKAANVNPNLPYDTLHFGAENEEWSQTTFTRGLYDTFYKQYIEDTYSSDVRMVRVKAYLPASIILTYNLYDRIIIDGQSHKINSIRIDLIDGKTELELITE